MISSVFPASASTAAAPQRAAADSPDVIAARLQQALANGGSFEDPTLGGLTIVKIPEPLTTQPAFMERQIAHNNAAGRSMGVIEQELRKVDAMIAKRRPDLAASRWDFKLVDGKFKVSGLDEADAKWLERKLNANDGLVDATKSFISTAVSELQTTEETPAHADYNYLSRRMENYEFSNVAEVLSDKLSFRALLQDSDLIVDSKRVTMGDGDRGMNGLNVAAYILLANRSSLERSGPFYATSYST